MDNLLNASVDEIANISAGETFSYRTLGEKSAKALYDALHEDQSDKVLNSEQFELDKKLELLGVNGLGQKKRQAVVAHFDNDPDKLLKATVSQISAVELGTSEVKRTLGEVAAESLWSFLGNVQNRKLLDELREQDVQMGAIETAETGASGKTFVITGTLPEMGRADAKKMIESAGGKVSGSVSRSTDYLVAGEKAGSKLDKAREYGVAVIDEKQMIAICGQD